MKKVFLTPAAALISAALCLATTYQEVPFTMADTVTTAVITNSTSPATEWVPVALYATYASNGIPLNIVTVTETSSTGASAVIDSVSVASNATAIVIDFDTPAVISARETLTVTRASTATNGPMTGWVLLEVTN